MTELTSWKKREIDQLRKEMDRVFQRVCADFGVPAVPSQSFGLSSLELRENESAVVLRARLVGIKPNELDISISGNTLTIRGASQSESGSQGESHYQVEKQTRSFSRSLSLPAPVVPEEIRATCREQTLEIVMPKRTPDETYGVPLEID
ncbi:MAG: Hsp20/alpha crystallin family protein [Desulfobacteraceae bacterium]|jgi:HSP20 family protein